MRCHLYCVATTQIFTLFHVLLYAHSTSKIDFLNFLTQIHPNLILSKSYVYFCACQYLATTHHVCVLWSYHQDLSNRHNICGNPVFCCKNKRQYSPLLYVYLSIFFPFDELFCSGDQQAPKNFPHAFAFRHALDVVCY